MPDFLKAVLADYSLVAAFVWIGLIVALSYYLSHRLTRGRLHGSAIAICAGLLLAYAGGEATQGNPSYAWMLSFFGGSATHGKKGVADIPVFAGIGIMGGAMIRDLAIVATSMGVRLEELRKTGLGGVVSLLIGVFIPFLVGACVARAFGYNDAVSMTTIGAGAATFIVGPVTGAALNAPSNIIALSVATGLVKAILVMIGTPFAAKAIGLNNPRTALIFGGLMGTTSGVAGGLAATDPKLVPYGAMTATFHTGLGCLLGPSVMYFIIRQFA